MTILFLCISILIFDEVAAPKYELKKDYGHTWIKFEGKDEWNACNIEFGVDIAGTGGDDAVITPVIALYDYRVIVAPQVIGKWSLRDDLSGTESDLRRYKVADVRAPIGKVGLVDELFRIAVRYMPSVIKVGIAGEEELILREIQRVFAENRIYTISIQPRPQTVREGNKIARIAATLLPFYETRMVYHTPGLSKLEYQLEYLGKTKHDDCADCLECALFNLSFPEKLSIDFFEGVNTPTEKRNIHSLPKAKEFNLQNNWMEYI